MNLFAAQSIFRHRDILIIFIILLAAYISFDSNGYQYFLSPTWYVNDKKSSTTKYFHKLRPIITDIDGDGTNEVILITSSLEIQILKTSSKSSTIFQPPIVAKKRLTNLKLTKGKAPIGLKVGYIDEYNETGFRRQVIAVVTEDLTVRLFNHQLDLIWEKVIAHNTLDMGKNTGFFDNRELAVFIFPGHIRNSTGSVIVGFSESELTSLSDVKSEEGMNDRRSLSATDEHPEMSIRANLEHFNVYALDAKTGHVVWRHTGQDEKSEQTKSLPRLALKLEIDDVLLKPHHGHGHGYSHWTVFRDSLLSELPHA